MTTFQLPKTDLSVSHLCLGGNVFGWSADAATSYEVLDKFVELGGNFIDTADAYAKGESERIVGRLIAADRERELADRLRADLVAPIQNGAEEGEILVLQGRPIAEPVVQHGPFVMNSEAEIRTAIEDYRSGKMGHISVAAG